LAIGGLAIAVARQVLSRPTICSVKYEEVYLIAYDSISDACPSLGRYFAFYNSKGRHQSLDRRMPDSVYYQGAVMMAA